MLLDIGICVVVSKFFLKSIFKMLSKVGSENRFPWWQHLVLVIVSRCNKVVFNSEEIRVEMVGIRRSG